MGTGGTLLSDMQNVVIMPVVALNMMVLLFLIDHASESYLASMKDKAERDNAKDRYAKLQVDIEFEHARLRLEIFWTFVLIAATAAALKLTLPDDLADNIIAAWFVGQGFALQPYVQSFISGIAVRNNPDVWKGIMDGATLLIDGDAYECHTHNVFNLTVISSTGTSNAAAPSTKYRVLQWQNVAQYTIASKAEGATDEKDTRASNERTGENNDGVTTNKGDANPNEGELYPYIRSRRGVH